MRFVQEGELKGLRNFSFFYLIIIYSSKACKCIYLAICFVNLRSFLHMMRNFIFESFKGATEYKCSWNYFLTIVVCDFQMIAYCKLSC